MQMRSTWGLVNFRIDVRINSETEEEFVFYTESRGKKKVLLGKSIILKTVIIIYLLTTVIPLMSSWHQDILKLFESFLRFDCF